MSDNTSEVDLLSSPFAVNLAYSPLATLELSISTILSSDIPIALVFIPEVPLPNKTCPDDKELLPVPPLATERSVPDQLLLLTLLAVAKEPKPETSAAPIVS